MAQVSLPPKADIDALLTVRRIMRKSNPHRIRDVLEMDIANEQRERDAFWSITHDDVKAEFMNGKGYVHQSPVMRRHAQALLKLIFLVEQWRVQVKDKGSIGFEKDCIRLNRSDFEPDFVYWNAETSATITLDNIFRPIPQLVVEIISKSTVKVDRGLKYEQYEEAEIDEYWIIDPDKKHLERYVLINQQYQLHAIYTSGSFSTPIMPGLQLDVDTLFNY